MRRPVVAVWDSAVGAFAPPMVVPSIGHAVRSFSDEVNRADGNNMLHAHPEDYALHHVAEFDEDYGTFSVPEEGARVLARGKDCVRSAQ